MSVYVDSSKHDYKGMTLCHMVADSPGELLAMARRISLPEKYLQNQGTWKEHFDVCKSKRKLAVLSGALEVISRELGRILRRKRAETSGNAWC